MKRLVFFLLAAMLFLTGCNDEKGRVFSFTDLHFNPFYDTTLTRELAGIDYRKWDNVFKKSKITNFSKYGDETNVPVFHSLIEGIKDKGGSADFVVFNGDILCHDFNDKIMKYTGASTDKERNEFIYKTMGYVSLKVKEAFPDKSVYFTLGNNDAYNGDYALVDDGKFLEDTDDLFFDNLIKNPSEKDEFLSTYSDHGYYSVKLPEVDNGRLISVNTIFFSLWHQPKQGTDPAYDQLKWLDKELAEAEEAGENVWVLLHIPPGVNVYGTQHKSKKEGKLDVELLWKEIYNTQFVDLMQKYERTITAYFAGHTHMDDFRMVYSDEDKALDYIHIVPSVTPVFRNNPGIQWIEYDRNSGELTDITTYYLNLENYTTPWNKEYKFSNTYQKELSVDNLEFIYKNIKSEKSEREKYVALYPVMSKAMSIDDSWKWYWCGIGCLTKEEFQKAYNEK